MSRGTGARVQCMAFSFRVFAVHLRQRQGSVLVVVMVVGGLIGGGVGHCSRDLSVTWTQATSFSLDGRAARGGMFGQRANTASHRGYMIGIVNATGGRGAKGQNRVAERMRLQSMEKSRTCESPCRT